MTSTSHSAKLHITLPPAVRNAGAQLGARYAAPDWLQAQWVLSQFAADRETARVACRRFVPEGVDVESPWQSLRGRIWLGGEDFITRMSAVADAFELAPEVVLDRSHQSAFKAAVYLLRRACNLPLTETARLGVVSPSRISRTQAELEEGKRLETMEALFSIESRSA